jgi:hypothetical protein
LINFSERRFSSEHPTVSVEVETELNTYAGYAAFDSLLSGRY